MNLSRPASRFQSLLFTTLFLAGFSLASEAMEQEGEPGLPLAIGGDLGTEANSPRVEPGAAPKPEPVLPVPPSLHLMVAVVWEGRDLEAHNVEALKQFRNQFAGIPLTHFLSPAYFLKGSAAAVAAQRLIRSVIRPHDQIGMTLAGWKSLATQAGVTFRSGPTFWGEALGQIDCTEDCGMDVAVHIYSEAELGSLMHTGLAVLSANGFGRPAALHTEGWVASPALLTAAVRAGFQYDFSAVPTELIAPRARLYPLFQWVHNIWPTVTPHTRPYQIANAAGALTEYPLTTAAIDYVSARDTVVLFKEYVELAQKEVGKSFTFPLVVYQESGKWNLPQLQSTLQGIFAYAAAQGVSLSPLVLPGMELPEVTGGPTVALSAPALTSETKTAVTGEEALSAPGAEEGKSAVPTVGDRQPEGRGQVTRLGH